MLVMLCSCLIVVSYKLLIQLLLIPGQELTTDADANVHQRELDRVPVVDKDAAKRQKFDVGLRACQCPMLESI